GPGGDAGPSGPQRRAVPVRPRGHLGRPAGDQRHRPDLHRLRRPGDMLPESGNFGDLFANRRDSAATAIIDLTGAVPREISYAALNARCDAFARGLRKAGIAPGTRIALMSGNCIAFVEAFFGAARAG